MLKTTDVNNKQLKKYARALFETALKDNVLDTLNNDMHNLTQALNEVQEQLKKNHSYGFLTTLKLLKKQKQQIFINNLLQSVNASKLIVNFASILIVNNQLNLLLNIVYNWQMLVNELKGFTKVVIITAVAINNTLEQKVVDALKQKQIKDFYIVKEVKPSILAGLILQIGSNVYDDSVKYKLNKASDDLLNNHKLA